MNERRSGCLLALAAILVSTAALVLIVVGLVNVARTLL